MTGWAKPGKEIKMDDDRMLIETLEGYRQMRELAYKLCVAIEQLPASEQQTAISIMASELANMVSSLSACRISRFRSVME